MFANWKLLLLGAIGLGSMWSDPAGEGGGFVWGSNLATLTTPDSTIAPNCAGRHSHSTWCTSKSPASAKTAPRYAGDLAIRCSIDVSYAFPSADLRVVTDDAYF